MKKHLKRLFISKILIKENYKDLIKLLKYSKKVKHLLLNVCTNTFLFILYHHMQDVKKLLSKYMTIFEELFTLFVTKDAYLKFKNKQDTYKIIDTLTKLGFKWIWQQKIEDKYRDILFI